MTGTDRIVGPLESSPATQFYLSANERPVTSEHIAGNFTVVRCYMRAVNRGNTSSFYGGAGSQVGSIDGVGTFRTRSAASNFLPSGFATDAVRWEDGPYDVEVPHDADGSKTITLRMQYEYGSVSRNLTALLALTTLPRGGADRFDGDWDMQLVERFDGSDWVLQAVERSDGSDWVRQI